MVLLQKVKNVTINKITTNELEKSLLDSESLLISFEKK